MNIRFINSKYDELFQMPDKSVVEVTFPDRQFSVKCEYIDDYHLRMGHQVFHICQLAEILEREHGSCKPEPIVTDEQAAWSLGKNGIILIGTCADGYDYTFCDKDMKIKDGGRLENPELSMNEARNIILEDLGLSKCNMVRENYLKCAEMAIEDDLEMIDGIINNGKKDEKTSVLDDLKEKKKDITHKDLKNNKEMER